MGRNKSRPDGYAPQLQFYLRETPEGGGLLHPGKIKASLDAQTRKECLVLVHGFNNTDSEAAVAYLGFRARQMEIFGTTDFSEFERRFGDTYWPGDADWWSFFDKLDFLIYPGAVHTAINSADELANVLWSMPNLEQVDFIGHSLGCRVILETMQLLRTRTLPLVRRVLLMAPAVPSEMLEPRGRFFILLRELSAEGTHIQILHSKEDWVLHFAFPPGQAMAGVAERSDRALGRFGPSPWMPGFQSTLTDMQVNGANHGDYWGHTRTPASRVATDAAGRFLRLGDPLARQLGIPRVLAPTLEPVPKRDLGVVRDT
jgi:pimeloyl-ACP methyl ester carboxylesterase